MQKSVLNSKIKLLKNRLVHKSAIRNGIPMGYSISQNSAKMGVPLQVYTLNPCYIRNEMQILAANII